MHNAIIEFIQNGEKQTMPVMKYHALQHEIHFGENDPTQPANGTEIKPLPEICSIP